MRGEQIDRIIEIVKPGLYDDTCPCGCGVERERNANHLPKFLPGHDAKLVAKLVRLIRDDSNDLTGRDAQEWLEFEGYTKLASKLAMQLLRFPKNGPTRKAARALIAAMPGGKEWWIKEMCGSINPNHDHYHTDIETDCAVHLVLNGWTASDIFRRKS
jgi:hypothetical protein